ncbi:hypothetical protein PSACC_01076 [Paramicrosporidium saccamoebae]|uniref:Uncharacterized protein n=1 Tax=Paramicrosporidium saccamoebae TaxID=1246581 RepID=A0A2H9TN05_9FUNG|nr:hypothetical protein PSACC_01076 [Paramicrosporidium saccamoebae]
MHASALKIRGNSEQLVVQSSGDAVTTLLRVLPEYEHNYYPLLQLLVNNKANIMEHYAKSCSSWTYDIFNGLVDWSLALPFLYQFVILHGQCIDTTPFRQFAIAKLMSLGLGAVLTKTTNRHASGFSTANMIKNFPNWCERFPNLFMTFGRTHSLDLPSIITTECLVNDYPNKALLLNALNEQLKTSIHKSLTELLLKLRVISHRKLVKLRSTLREHICSSNSGTFFHTMNIHLVGCPWPRQYTYDLSFFEEFLSLDNESLIVGLRAILAVYNQDMVIEILSGLPPIRLHGFSNLLPLCEDLSHISLEHQRQFMMHLGIDYDSYMLQMPYSFWADRPDMLKKLHLNWRFQWYAKWHLKPAIPTPSNLTAKPNQIPPLRHLGGAGITADRILRYLFKLTSESENYTQTDLCAFRPRVWLSRKDLEHFLGVLVYATVRFQRLFGIFDRSYCDALHSEASVSPLFYRHDFTMRPFHPISEFAKAAQANFQAQKQALQSISSNWKLLTIVETDDICQLLAPLHVTQD